MGTASGGPGRDALTPTWAEIRRAEKALGEILTDGKSHGVRALQACLLDAKGSPRESVHGERLQLASADDIPRVVTPSHPIMAGFRLAWAASEAVVDLAAQGTVVEVALNDQTTVTGTPSSVAGST